MHVSVVLLCLGLVVSVSVCHPQRGRPLNGGVQMRNNIKLLSMITVVHIKNYLTEVPHTPLTQLLCMSDTT